MDFDIYKTPGQSHDQRCQRMIICAALIGLDYVLNVTVTQATIMIGDGIECLISTRYRSVIGVHGYLRVTKVASVTGSAGGVRGTAPGATG